MNIGAYKNLKPCLILAACCFLFGCLDAPAGYCEKLQNIAKSSSLEKQLKVWTTKNVVTKEIYFDDVTLGGGMWPGKYWYKVEFDWKILGFTNNSQIRLIGSEIEKDENERITGIQSVFFGEQSRYGIIVRLPDSDEFGVEQTYLTQITSDLAVVCRARD